MCVVLTIQASYVRHMERWNVLPGKYRDQVKMGIKNQLNRLIVGKPTQPVAPPPPVPALNLAAINRFLEDDCEVEEEPIYQHLPDIPVANDFCYIEDGLDNEEHWLDDERDGDNQFQDGYRSDQIRDSDSHIEYREIAGESQGDRGSWPRNRPIVDDSDDDGEQLPDEECQVREKLEVEKSDEVEEEVEEVEEVEQAEEAEEAKEAEDGGEETDGVNGYEHKLYYNVENCYGNF